ncbi:MAG: hypothetical protein KAG06_04865 [Methylococcales bacterium]|nr:hypothetical protein [Methylococcales bacterium]
MDNSVDLDRILVKPTQPKNSLQLLLWLIFEPTLLANYSADLSYKKRTWNLIKSYPLVILICFLGYIISTVIIFYLEFPLLFPKEFETSLMAEFTEKPSLFREYIFYAGHSFFKFLTALGIGLVLGLIQYIVGGLVGGLVVSLIFGLTGGLAIELAEGLGNTLMMGDITATIDDSLTGILSFAFAMGVAMGLMASPAMSLTVALAFSLLFGATFMVAGGVVFGLAIGVIYGLIYALGVYTGRCRLFFYPFYCLFPISFSASPYFYDEVICFPIWNAKKRFGVLATKDPESAYKFLTFLQKYRPSQTDLKDHLSYAAHAGAWQQRPFVNENVLEPPNVEKLKPSEDWLIQLEKVQKQYLSYHLASVSSKKQQLKQFSIELDLFRLQTRMENKEWRDYYLQAIMTWHEAGKVEVRNLKIKTHALNQNFVTSLL